MLSDRLMRLRLYILRLLRVPEEEQKKEGALWRALFLKYTELLEFVQLLLDPLSNIKKGNFFSKVKALVAVTQTVFLKFRKDTRVHQVLDLPITWLEHEGYTEFANTLMPFVYDILKNAGKEPWIKTFIYANGEEIPFNIHIFESDYGKGDIAFINDSRDDDLCRLFVRGSDTSDEMPPIVRDCIWSAGSDLTLDTDEDSINSCSGYLLRPMVDPGPYIGKVGPEVYATRLQKYSKETSRTVILEGPSGVGKSVLARHIAKEIETPIKQTLKLTGTDLQELPVYELQDLISLVRPTIFLIDDLNNYSAERVEDLLDLLERLHSGKGLLTIITRMRNLPSERCRGGGYVEGLRPGRIDEVFTLHSPDIKDRKLILDYYFDMYKVPPTQEETMKELLKKTDGLTGAYLRELACRLGTHGWLYWSEELDNLLYMAPEVGSDLRWDTVPNS